MKERKGPRFGWPARLLTFFINISSEVFIKLSIAIQVKACECECKPRFLAKSLYSIFDYNSEVK